MPARKNKHAGEIYGKLTAIEETGETHLRSNIWLFRCDCGNEVTRKISDVRRAVKKGQTPSCGCNARKDYTNKRKGDLVALSWTGKVDERNSAIWTFKCDCGTELERIPSHVFNGMGKTHCGCRTGSVPKHVDHTGKKFGKLTALYVDGSDPRHGVKWKCKCDCGIEIDVFAKKLNNKTKTHCGCKNKEGNNSATFKGVGTLSSTYFTKLKSNAEIRNLSVEIDIDFLWELYNSQNGKCALSGVDIPLGPVRKMIGSVDRIDSTKGYTKDNVQWVHKQLNLMKMAISNDDFKEWCKRVTEHNQ